MNEDIKTRGKFPSILHSGFAVILLCVSGYQPVNAETIRVSIADLDNAIYEMDTQPDALSRLALQKIQNALNDAELTLGAGELIYSDSQTDLNVNSGCTRTEIRSLDTNIALASNSALSVTLDTLYQPIQLSIELDTSISVVGRAKQIIGVRLGSCQELGNDNFSFDASGTAQLSLQLELRLNPSLNDQQQLLTLRPEVSLEGRLEKQNINVDVDDSLLRSLLEDFIEDEIDDAFDDAQIVQALTELEQRLRDSIESELDDGRIQLELPSATDEQVNSLYALLTPQADFSLSLGYMRTQRVALLAALIVGDEAGVQAIISHAVQCEVAGVLQTTMTHQPVYQLNASGCEATQIPTLGADEDDMAYYEDAQCQTSLDFYATNTVQYCTQVLDTERLGNAASFTSELNRWTLSPGTRFDVGALPLAGKQQPFTQRVNYKTVPTGMGECSLEMRIHSASPNAVASTPSKTLIAFHGGSWQRRSSGALGLEAFAAQFVDNGYVVFVPFYRLIGTAEGNEACNDASLEQVLDDAHDALTWVQDNGSRYGVVDKPVVFGQSAGGHLAAVLAVERPTEVASAVLFYAPTDFAEFARQLLEGEIETVTGQGILEAVVGETLETLDVQLPLIQRNSLAARVVDRQGIAPPFFMLHGIEDSVLPVSQSVRMCNALAGNPEEGPASNLTEQPDTLRSIVNCGEAGSELHLITEGEHALDLCIAEELCLSGSAQSAALTADSVSHMLDWIRTAQADPALLQDSTGSTSSGSLGYLGIVSLLLMFLRRRRICIS